MIFLWVLFPTNVLAQGVPPVEYLPAPKQVSPSNPFQPLLPKRKPVEINVQEATGAGSKPFATAQSIAGSQKAAPPPDAKPIKPLPELRITGWVWNTDKPQAIVNGVIVSKGEMVPDTEVKIVSIHRTKIVVSFDGRTEVVTP